MPASPTVLSQLRSLQALTLERKEFRKKIRGFCERNNLTYVNQDGTYYIESEGLAISHGDDGKLTFTDGEKLPTLGAPRSKGDGTSRKSRSHDYDALGYSGPPLTDEQLDYWSQAIYDIASQELEEESNGKLLWYAFSFSTVGRMFKNPQDAWNSMVQKYTQSKGQAPTHFHIFQNHLIGIGPFSHKES